MMLCHGGLMVFKGLGQHIPSCPDLETQSDHSSSFQSSCRRRGIFSQTYDFNSGNSGNRTGSKPTRLNGILGNAKDNPLGDNEVSSKASKPINVRRREEMQDETTMGNSSSDKDNLWPPDAATKRAVEATVGKQIDEWYSKVGTSRSLQVSDGEDWRSLSRVLARGQKISSISNQDLMRLAELRFSNDMHEGDSGSQVVLLQKALSWLGYMSKQCELSGYFGTETRQALGEFQKAHGVSQTGAWGALSKQALWHTISGEILHRVVDEKASNSEDSLKAPINTSSVSPIQAWQSWIPMKLVENIKAGVPENQWMLLSGLALLVIGMLFGLILSRFSNNTSTKSNSVKRKIVRSSDLEHSKLQSQNEKHTHNNPSLNGATVVDTCSQFSNRKPSIILNDDVAGKLDPGPAYEKKPVQDWGSRSNLGLVGQQGNAAIPSHHGGRTTAYGPRLAVEKVTSPKPAAAETMRKGKQHDSWSKPLKDRTEDGSHGHWSSSRGKPSRFPRESHKDFVQRPVPRIPLSTLQKDAALMPVGKVEDDDSSLSRNKGVAATQAEDELNVRKCIDELRKIVEVAEENGQAAVHALAEERKRSMELEEKISRQRESAAALEEEVRVLKESHDALLDSLREINGSPSASRGAALLYERYKRNGGNNRASY